MSAAGGSITLLVGTILLRLTVTGTYQRYVRVGMGPWLVVAGGALVALGAVTIALALRDQRRSPAGDDAADDHAAGDHGAGHAADSHTADGHGAGHDHGPEGHGHGIRVGWLLLAPVAALLLVAPPALGSYGVDRSAAVDVRAGASDLVPLDAGAGPVPMSLVEFSQRAFDHDGATFNGATVQLTGFVADARRPFRLARYQIACCAVDAAPVVVHVTGTVGDLPAIDRWVTVTGTFRPGGDVPTISATSVVEIPAPDDPYE